jgi:hypothetical protein
MLVFSTKDFNDIAVDTILLLAATISLGIAFISQMSADKEARKVEKLIHELNLMDKNIEDDMNIDKTLRYRLDKILALEEEIYHKVGGRKTSKQLVKEYRLEHPDRTEKKEK